MPFPKNAHKKSPVIKDSCKPRLLTLLAEKPMTVKELCPLLERDANTVQKALRKLTGKVYICGWEGQTPIWTLGSQPHVPRPVMHSAKSAKTMAWRSQRSMVDYLNCSYVTTERIWGI